MDKESELKNADLHLNVMNNPIKCILIGSCLIQIYGEGFLGVLGKLKKDIAAEIFNTCYSTTSSYCFPFDINFYVMHQTN